MTYWRTVELNLRRVYCVLQYPGTIYGKRYITLGQHRTTFHPITSRYMLMECSLTFDLTRRIEMSHLVCLGAKRNQVKRTPRCIPRNRLRGTFSKSWRYAHASTDKRTHIGAPYRKDAQKE